jgi:hypothetical protein
VAIGAYAGQSFSRFGSVSVGYQAGQISQGTGSVAIGYQAGQTGQGPFSVAMGFQAGQISQGTYAIAIGYLAGATGQSNNSIVLNASGQYLSAGNTGTFISPIRTTNDNTSNTLVYNTTTSEVLYNTAKTFVIPHPNDKEKYLVHGCLEGPEGGIYYRGKGSVDDGRSTTVLLPDYVRSIGRNFTIQVTPIYCGEFHSGFNVSDVEDGQFTVYGKNGSFHWLVLGERVSILVEPRKNDVFILGEGPYTYISPGTSLGVGGRKATLTHTYIS